MCRLSVLGLAAFMLGCSSLDYKPINSSEFASLVSDGCSTKDNRFNVRGRVSAAYKETVVLWDGVETGKTAAVRLPRQGIGSKIRGSVAKSRYDVNLEVLRRLQGTDQTASFSLQCDSKDRAPQLVRMRYEENGLEREIEFD